MTKIRPDRIYTLDELRAPDAPTGLFGLWRLILLLDRLGHRLAPWSPRALYREAKAFWQRGHRGWADRDVWNLDHHIASVISGGCRHLADHAHGYPSQGFCTGINESVLADEEQDDRGMAEWQATLRQIAAGLDQHVRDDWQTPAQFEAQQAAVEHSLYLLKRWFKALWD